MYNTIANLCRHPRKLRDLLGSVWEGEGAETLLICFSNKGLERREHSPATTAKGRAAGARSDKNTLKSKCGGTGALRGGLKPKHMALPPHLGCQAAKITVAALKKHSPTARVFSTGAPGALRGHLSEYLTPPWAPSSPASPPPCTHWVLQ